MDLSKNQNGVTKVAVLGAGIIGISSALRILDAPLPGRRVEVTVLANKFTPHTTGDGSAGFWNPYIFGDIPEQRLRFWCSETFAYLLDLWNTPEAYKCGVGLLSAYGLAEAPIEDPCYRDIFLNWRDMTAKELQMFPKKYKFGKFFTTMYAECSKLLPHMMERIKAKGGKIVQRTVNHLSELIGEFDVVVNCPGVEAARLVPDSAVQPIRGQTIRVRAPWIKHGVVSEEFYILLNADEVICGGTHQKGDWNREVDPNDRNHIWQGCCDLVPSLKNAHVIKEWVGLRPGRSGPRLERETLENKEGTQRLQVIHNYGHGGSGVTLFWGCAKEVVSKLQDILELPQNGAVHLQSHL